MKRDYVEEILLKKERAKRSERDHILRDRKYAINAVVEHCQKHIDVYGLNSDSYLKQDNEIHRYIPISVIACAESYFRAVIKELIDFGAPFSENAANFNKTKDIKFDFAVVQAIQGKRVTVGDFVSHLLSMKSFDDISSTLSILTGRDFLNELKSYFFRHEYYDDEKGYELFMPSIDNLTENQINEVGKIYKDVQEIFKLRNIFCHEAAEPEIIDIPQIYSCYENTMFFLETTNEFIWDLVEPNRPTSNYELGVKLNEELKKFSVELENLVQSIVYASDEPNQEFLEIHNAWKDYKGKRIDSIAKDWEGGSGQGIAMLGEDIYVTKNRLIELKEEIKNGKFFDITH